MGTVTDKIGLRHWWNSIEPEGWRLRSPFYSLLARWL